MWLRPRLFHLLGAVCLALGLALPAQAQGPALPAQALKRGVNVLGYDPIWKEPAKARFQLRHLQAIRDGGFDHVRVNLHAFEHMDAQGRLSPAWFRTLDEVLAAALNAGLQVIVDQHNFNDCAKAVEACRTRLKAFWRQVAPRYSGAPDAVLFEILNEPNGEMDAVWNEVLAENLQIIRESNPKRRVVVGPKSWNSMDHLDSLKLPEADRNLVVTFHYYSPFPFTHQGASWVPEFKNASGITWGTAAEREQVGRDFDKVLAWAQKAGRSVLLGEFGAYETGAMPHRVAWPSAVARAAEARGFAWSYWQFDSDFIVWDMKADGWVKPILNALVPAPGASATAAGAASARGSDPALDHLINVAKVGSWSVYGDGQSTSRSLARPRTRPACAWWCRASVPTPGTSAPRRPSPATSARATGCRCCCGRGWIPTTARRRRACRSRCSSLRRRTRPSSPVRPCSRTSSSRSCSAGRRRSTSLPVPWRCPSRWVRWGSRFC